MKILIGIDDSPCSREALQFVRRLPWPARSQFIVVTAMRPMVMSYAETYVPSGAASEILEEQTRTHQELVSRAEIELRDAGLPTEARVLTGDPRESIVQIAKDEGVDLIVVGSHGRSGIAKLLMGSVATHVATHAPCSVLVVKSGEAA